MKAILIYKLFLISFILLIQNNYFSQKKVVASESLAMKTAVSTNTGCIEASEAYTKKYKQQSFYIPSKNDQVITLKITVHVFIPLNDSGKWQTNNNTFNGLPALKFLFDSITNGHQERYSAKRSATYLKDFNSPYVRDSKIKFEITNIYFYPEAVLYTSLNDYALFEHIEKTDPERINEGMPIVFNNSTGPGHLSSYKGAAAVVTTLGADDIIFCRSHLLHEIGHTFGLGHTYKNGVGAGSDWQSFNGACGSDDYLSDVFPSNNPACQLEGEASKKPENAPCFSCYEFFPDTSNNVMAGLRYNLWMSPLQMGRRIRNMHLNNNVGRNIRQFAKDVESDHKNTWIISKNEEWDFDIQLYKDLLVKTGVTLTIKCKMAFALNGKIKLEPGAILIVDGGEITCWCKNGNWLGVETPKKKKGDTGKNIPVKLINNGALNKTIMQVPYNKPK